ncbi:MAG TPA: hypothetical protein VIJ17_14305 [Pseudolabrys sp.]
MLFVAFDDVLKRSKADELKRLLLPQPASVKLKSATTPAPARTPCLFRSPGIF